MSEMKSLQFVYLPNTLQYIYQWGIHFSDPSLPNLTPNPGTALIFFEEKSQIKYIGIHGISYKDTVNTCDPIFPTLNGSIVYINHLNVFSSYEFQLRDVMSKTTNIPYCLHDCTVNHCYIFATPSLIRYFTAIFIL